MASLSKSSTGPRLLVIVEGRRRSCRLTGMKRSDAHAFTALVEDLVTNKKVGRPHDEATMKQVDRLSMNLRDKLARLGLIRGIETGVPICDVIDRFMEQLQCKPRTKNIYRAIRRNLGAYFAGRALASITPAEAGRFLQFLKDQGLAPATCSRRIIACRTLWNWSMKGGYASSNPFREVEAGHHVDPSRKAYIDTETIEMLIAQATPEMALALALSRYAGLRVPSELLTLRWEDVNFTDHIMTVHSPKTERHAGGAMRVLPLFDEVSRRMTPLRQKSGYVFQQDRRTDGWWMSLKQLCQRCNVDVWKKLWHNLRASCQTDLSRNFAPHVVCSWLGNSLAVAEKHYLQVTPADLSRAQFRAHSIGEPGRTEANERRDDLMNHTEIPENQAIRETADCALSDHNRLNLTKDKPKTYAELRSEAVAVMRTLGKRRQAMLFRFYGRAMARGSK